jgi:hypothetical protein
MEQLMIALGIAVFALVALALVVAGVKSTIRLDREGRRHAEAASRYADRAEQALARSERAFAAYADRSK